jgi:hypothetical protein
LKEWKDPLDAKIPEVMALKKTLDAKQAIVDEVQGRWDAATAAE